MRLVWVVLVGVMVAGARRAGAEEGIDWNASYAQLVADGFDAGRGATPDVGAKVAEACACGCGVFEVGTASMLPTGPGGTLSLEYDFQKQDRNWHGTSRSPAAGNTDRRIVTHFVTASLQYMFDRDWGVQVAIPYDYRTFHTVGEEGDEPEFGLNWGSLGDVRVEGIYTGFSPEMPGGVTFGLKLPTGNSTHNNAAGDIDRDTEIGTGSTDLLVGAFYHDTIGPEDAVGWFAQVKADVPMFVRDRYRPGVEVDGAVGLSYDDFRIGEVRIVPVGQVLVSVRTRDTGANSAQPVASGYERILLTAGVEVHLDPWMLYGDVEVPVFQDVRGEQLVAPVAFKVVLSYSF